MHGGHAFAFAAASVWKCMVGIHCEFVRFQKILDVS